EVGAGLAIHPNGVRMLRRLGFDEQLQQFGARWSDPQFRRWDGSMIAPWWPAGSADNIEIYGMHRADLLNILLDPLPPELVHPDHRCVGLEEQDDEVVVRFANGVCVHVDVVV